MLRDYGLITPKENVDMLKTHRLVELLTEKW